MRLFDNTLVGPAAAAALVCNRVFGWVVGLVSGLNHGGVGRWEPEELEVTMGVNEFRERLECLVEGCVPSGLSKSVGIAELQFDLGNDPEGAKVVAGRSPQLDIVVVASPNEFSVCGGDAEPRDHGTEVLQVRSRAVGAGCGGSGDRLPVDINPG